MRIRVTQYRGNTGSNKIELVVGRYADAAKKKKKKKKKKYKEREIKIYLNKKE